VIRRSLPVVVLVVAHLMVGSGLDVPVVRPLLALILFVGLPTVALARTSIYPTEDPVARGFYAFGSTILGLILLGLAVNTVLPVLGVQRPLQPAVLSAAMLLANAVLLLLPAARPLLPPDWTSRIQRVLGARFELVQTLAGIALVLAIGGAIRLNNGAGGAIALAAQVCVALAVLVLLSYSSEDRGRDLRTLVVLAATLLLATSLRGWHIVGHDIQAEYLAFLGTNENQHWQMSLWRNAYNACLSVTLLPSLLSQITGLPGVLVFKVLLQLVFALVPMLTYLLGRRYLPRRPALVAAVMVMAFPTFFNDMPYLVRQEIAFFFVALLLLAATEPRTGRPAWALRVLVGFFGVGVVLSHYSTTYVLLIGLVFGLAAVGGLRLLSRWWPSRYAGSGPGAPLVLLSPVLVLFLAVASWAWAGPATNTGGHAISVVGSTLRVILGQDADKPGSSDRNYFVFGGEQPPPRQRLDSFVEETIDLRNSVPQEWLLDKKLSAVETRPTIAAPSTVPLTPAGRAVKEAGADPEAVNARLKLIGAGLVQLFLFVGLAGLVWRRRQQPDIHGGPDRVRALPDEMVGVVLGAMAALGMVVVIPKLSVEYGVLRAFQQTLLVVAPVLAVGIMLAIRPLGRRFASLNVIIPLGLLLTFTSVVSAVIGGYPGRLALSNSGLYFDRQYVSDSEVRASDWLARLRADTGSEAPIDAKKIIGYRLVSRTLREEPVADRLFPTLLSRSTYVFADAQMVTKKQSTVFYSGDHITYEYPMQVLDSQLDLVYSSRLARIYR
jgi:uncharacterized membrane protein